MWILILTLASIIPSTPPELHVQATPIMAYTTLQECESERIRIDKEFTKAYADDPLEYKYSFECKDVRKKQHA